MSLPVILPRPTQLLACAILTVACDHGAAHDHGHDRAKKYSHDEHSHESHEKDAPPAQAQAPQLNDGKRWPANPETTAAVTQLAKLVDAAVVAPPAAGDDAKDSADRMRDTYQTIFKECTMTGPAHEQLHRFLVPIAGLIKQVEAERPAATALGRLKAHLAGYPKYFE